MKRSTIDKLDDLMVDTVSGPDDADSFTDVGALRPVEVAVLRFVTRWGEEFGIGLSRTTVVSVARSAFASGLPCHFHVRLKDWFDAAVEQGVGKASHVKVVRAASELVNGAFLLLEFDAEEEWRDAVDMYATLLDRSHRSGG